MICFHRYKYIGRVSAKQWLGGVTNGIMIDVIVDAKQCEKCGKMRVV